MSFPVESDSPSSTPTLSPPSANSSVAEEAAEDKDVVASFRRRLADLAKEAIHAHKCAPPSPSPWSLLDKDEARARAMEAVETEVEKQLEAFMEDGRLEFAYPKLSSPRNVRFDPLRGTMPVESDAAAVTTTALLEQRPRPSMQASVRARKYSLILLTLQKVWRLLETNAFATKREIYYESVNEYESQGDVDSAVGIISAMLGIPRLHLHVLATSKGLVAGSLTMTMAGGDADDDQSRVDCRGTTTGELVPQDVSASALRLESDCEYVLVVEKDATFQRLLDEGFADALGPGVLVTGKGVPDLNTRQLVHRLWSELAVPVMALVDADPWGVDIMLTYRFGSMAMAFSGETLAVPAMK